MHVYLACCECMLNSFVQWGLSTLWAVSSDKQLSEPSVYQNSCIGFSSRARHSSFKRSGLSESPCHHHCCHCHHHRPAAGGGGLICLFQVSSNTITNLKLHHTQTALLTRASSMLISTLVCFVRLIFLCKKNDPSALSLYL